MRVYRLCYCGCCTRFARCPFDRKYLCCCCCHEGVAIDRTLRREVEKRQSQGRRKSKQLGAIMQASPAMGPRRLESVRHDCTYARAPARATTTCVGRCVLTGAACRCSGGGTVGSRSRRPLH